jgi:hypothetical protein
MPLGSTDMLRSSLARGAFPAPSRRIQQLTAHSPAPAHISLVIIFDFIPVSSNPWLFFSFPFFLFSQKSFRAITHLRLVFSSRFLIHNKRPFRGLVKFMNFLVKLHEVCRVSRTSLQQIQ